MEAEAEAVEVDIGREFLSQIFTLVWDISGQGIKSPGEGIRKTQDLVLWKSERSEL